MLRNWTGSGDVRHQGLKGLRGAKWVAPAEPKKGYWSLSEESSDNLKQHLTVLLNASGFFLFFFFWGCTVCQGLWWVPGISFGFTTSMWEYDFSCFIKESCLSCRIQSGNETSDRQVQEPLAAKQLPWTFFERHRIGQKDCFRALLENAARNLFKNHSKVIYRATAM